MCTSLLIVKIWIILLCTSAVRRYFTLPVPVLLHSETCRLLVYNHIGKKWIYLSPKWHIHAYRLLILLWKVNFFMLE